MKMKVALVAHGVHDGGGMERACAELVRHAHAEVDFTVISPDLSPSLSSLVYRWIPVRVPSSPSALRFSLFWLQAAWALRTVDADLIHAVGAIIPNRVDVVQVQFCHAGFIAATRHLSPRAESAAAKLNASVTRLLALAAERWCYRPSRVTALAAVSDGVRCELDAHYPGIDAVVIPNGVDGQRFRPDPDARRDLRAVHDVKDAAVALFVGGDWYRKGLDIAIEAVARLCHEGHHVVLWIVGSGDHRRFHSLARRLGVGPQIQFFGARDDTERFYAAADILLYPTCYEAFSLVTLEAAASGLPIVMPPVNGAAELVGQEEAGLLAERNLESVSAAITRLLGDQALSARQSRAARHRAEKYTWASAAQSTLELYRSCV